MPAPASIDEFVDLIRKSGVLEDGRLSAYVLKLKANPNFPKHLDQVAGQFVQDGMLTYFQAEQFLQGKWKRFQIGKYKVLERIGSGGMGQVFLCEHKLMRRRVAVKVLPTAKAADPSSLERFYREARAVAALDHQNIVRAYDIDQDDNLHFLVMEYVDGSSLQDIIKKAGRMDVVRACHYMYWSAIGLQNAHENGLIHRDIKPGNVLVDRQGVVKILDLGLARFFNDEEDLLTKKYDESVLGTADYLAPEQAVDSHNIDGRADIYSLGATFYFLLSGHAPFTEGTVAQKLLWHQTRNPKPIRDVRPEVPTVVAAILEKMMAKNPDDRYATPLDLANALLPLTQTPIDPPPVSEMPQLSIAATGGIPTVVSATSRSMVIAPRTPSANSGNSAMSISGTNVTGSGSDIVRDSLGSAVTERNRTPAPVIEPIPESKMEPPSDGANWDHLSIDTANASRDDTQKRKKGSKTDKRQKAQVAQTATETAALPLRTVEPRNTKKSLLLLGGLVIAILLAGGAYFAFFRDSGKPKEGDGTTVPGERKLIVSKSGTGYPTIAAAIQAFKPGDKIVLADDEWEEIVNVNRVKGLDISSEKKTVWKVPSKATNPQVMLTLTNVENCRISNIVFRAGHKADYCIRLADKCPGAVIDGVELDDAKIAGLSFLDCQGEKLSPVKVTRCRIRNSSNGDSVNAISFTSHEPKNVRPGTPGPSSLDVVISDCRMEGPFKSAAFLMDGGAQRVDFRNNRIWSAGDGVLFKKPRPETAWLMLISNNTFHGLTGSGFRIEDATAMKRPDIAIALENNLYLGAAALSGSAGDLGGAVFLKAKGNFRRKGMAEGVKELFQANEIDGDLAADVGSDKKFLSYDKSHPFFKADKGKPVGAVVE